MPNPTIPKPIHTVTFNPDQLDYLEKVFAEDATQGDLATLNYRAGQRSVVAHIRTRMKRN